MLKAHSVFFHSMHQPLSVLSQVCLMALGHASPEHYAVLFEELPGLIDDYQRPGKQKKGIARPEEVSWVETCIYLLHYALNQIHAVFVHLWCPQPGQSYCRLFNQREMLIPSCHQQGT